MYMPVARATNGKCGILQLDLYMRIGKDKDDNGQHKLTPQPKDEALATFRFELHAPPDTGGSASTRKSRKLTVGGSRASKTQPSSPSGGESGGETARERSIALIETPVRSSAAKRPRGRPVRRGRSSRASDSEEASVTPSAERKPGINLPSDARPNKRARGANKAGPSSRVVDDGHSDSSEAYLHTLDVEQLRVRLTGRRPHELKRG